MDTKNYINDCEWEITDDGTLVIRPANGRIEGTLHWESFFLQWRGGTFKRIRIEGHIMADKSTAHMFSGCPALEDISGIGNLDTSRVENMTGMFSGCPAIRTLAGLEDLDTSSVTSIDMMFRGCTALNDISALSAWDVGSIQIMDSLFRSCNALKDITALKNWNTKYVRNISSMFFGCTSLEDVSPLAKWNMAGVRTMHSTFRGCTAIRNIDSLEGWDVSNVEDMDLIFTDCTYLLNREKIFNEWQLSNRRLHYKAVAYGAVERVVSERRMFAMSDGPMTCPREGTFVGWKKCCDGKLVKLLIPADARRSSALGKKCRCDRAQVLDITDMDGNHAETAVSSYDNNFVYRKGKTVSVPDFDEDRFDECSPSIHFFMDIADANNYL